MGDLSYRIFGVPGKEYTLILCGVLQGVFAIGFGVYINDNVHPSRAHYYYFNSATVILKVMTVGVLIVLIILLALFMESGNGVNFSLVPHCNPGTSCVFAAGHTDY